MAAHLIRNRGAYMRPIVQSESKQKKRSCCKKCCKCVCNLFLVLIIIAIGLAIGMFFTCPEPADEYFIQSATEGVLKTYDEIRKLQDPSFDPNNDSLFGGMKKSTIKHFFPHELRSAIDNATAKVEGEIGWSSYKCQIHSFPLRI